MTVSRDAALEMLRSVRGIQEKDAETCYSSVKRKNNPGFMGLGALLILLGLAADNRRFTGIRISWQPQERIPVRKAEV